VHEFSVALEICRIAEEQVGWDALPRVTEVAVEVGDDAGIEVGNLEFCLEALLSHPPFVDAKPMIFREAGDGLRVRYLDVDDGRPT